MNSLVGPGMAAGTKVPAFFKAIQMSNTRGLVNHRIRLLKSQPGVTTQSQGMNRQPRYDEKYYKPTCYRDRVYERTWPEYELAEEFEETPKPATGRRPILRREGKRQNRRTYASWTDARHERFDDTRYTPSLWTEKSYQNTWEEPPEPEATKPNKRQSRTDEWAETR